MTEIVIVLGLFGAVLAVVWVAGLLETRRDRKMFREQNQQRPTLWVDKLEPMEPPPPKKTPGPWWQIGDCQDTQHLRDVLEAQRRKMEKR